jgi:hypothetical protein
VVCESRVAFGFWGWKGASCDLDEGRDDSLETLPASASELDHLSVVGAGGGKGLVGVGEI